MGQILHGSACLISAVRRAIQHSQESLKTLAARHGINPKTVAKWRKRTDVEDAAMGPKEVRSTVLTSEQEAAVVAFRKLTLLPLDLPVCAPAEYSLFDTLCLASLFPAPWHFPSA